MKTILPLLLVSLSLGACAAEPSEPEVATESALSEGAALLQELEDSQQPDKHGTSKLVGLWHGLAPFPASSGTVYLDMYWVVGHDSAWHVVYAYADEALTKPLLRWDLLRAYDVTGVAPNSPQTQLVTWNNLTATLYTYAEVPALFRATGLDDCNLRAGKLTSITNGCGAPFFPFARCELLDFARVERDVMTFGDPQQGDRCQERPTQDEAWSFQRVALTPAVVRKLLTIR